MSSLSLANNSLLQFNSIRVLELPHNKRDVSLAIEQNWHRQLTSRFNSKIFIKKNQVLFEKLKFFYQKFTFQLDVKMFNNPIHLATLNIPQNIRLETFNITSKLYLLRSLDLRDNELREKHNFDEWFPSIGNNWAYPRSVFHARFWNKLKIIWKICYSLSNMHHKNETCLYKNNNALSGNFFWNFYSKNI